MNTIALEMGFKSNLFLKKVDENLHCPICHDVFDNPVSCLSGHTFCSECIENWLEENKKCPVGNKPLTNEALVQNLTVKGIIDNMGVYCDLLCAQNTESRPAKRIKIENNPALAVDYGSTFHDDYEGERDDKKCCWTGQLHELQAHRKTCGFQQVTCPYENCNQEMKRKELEKHKETCKYRTVVCEECAACLVRFKLQNHLENDCPNAMVPCSNNCSTDGEVTKIRRLDLDEHLINVCGKAIVSCPFEEQGCSVQVERQHVDKHVQDNMAAHMVLLGNKCSALVEENNLLKENLNHMQGQLLSTCTYTWTICDYPKISVDNPIGFYTRSPSFWLCGYKWHILLYPNGNSRDDTGYISLFLENVGGDDSTSKTMFNISSNDEFAILLRLAVISQKPGTDDVYHQEKHIFTNRANDWGWHYFMKASDALSPTYCNNGRLMVQCTIEPDKS